MSADDVFTAVLVALAVLPLSLSVFFYVTRPVSGSRWRRRWSRAWMTTWVGPVVLGQKVAMIALLSYICVVRFTGGFPGREAVAVTLYTLLLVSFWAFFFLLRHTQKEDEQAAREAEKVLNEEKEER